MAFLLFIFHTSLLSRLVYSGSWPSKSTLGRAMSALYQGYLLLLIRPDNVKTPNDQRRNKNKEPILLTPWVRVPQTKTAGVCPFRRYSQKRMMGPPRVIKNFSPQKKKKQKLQKIPSGPSSRASLNICSWCDAKGRTKRKKSDKDGHNPARLYPSNVTAPPPDHHQPPFFMRVSVDLCASRSPTKDHQAQTLSPTPDSFIMWTAAVIVSRC